MSRRLSPAEADALVAHLTPEERRRQITLFLEALKIKGINAREVFDAAGRSYIMADLDQVRAVLGDAVADAMLGIEQTQPLFQSHRPPAA